MFTIKNGRKYFSVLTKVTIKNENVDEISKLTEGLKLEEIKDDLGATLLHWSVLAQSQKTTKFLINNGCDVNAQNKKGKTPLLIAIRLRDFLAVEILLGAKANVFLCDNEGMNSLKAVFTVDPPSRINLIKLFTNHLKKCDLNDKELASVILEASWPIYYAIHLRNSEIIRLMLEAGLSIDSYAEENRGMTALQEAICKGDVEIIKILLDHGANPNANRLKTPFNRIFSNIKVFETFLNHAPFLEQFNTDGTTYSFESLMKVDLTVIELILKYKIKLSVKDERGDTILHNLILNPHPKIIDLIAKTNFDVNMTDDDGNTLLHCVLVQSHMDAMPMLINKGADVNAKNKNGDTPLIVAIVDSAEQWKIDLLLQNGATLDEEMQTIILNKVAEEQIPTDIIIPILKHMAVMHFQGSAISRVNLNLMKRLFKAYDYFEEYLQELHSMKHKLITKKKQCIIF